MHTRISFYQWLLVLVVSWSGATLVSGETLASPGEKLVGFFGTMDYRPPGSSVVMKQIAETAGFVNTVVLGDWGDWDSPAGRQDIKERMIGELLDARLYGVKKAVLMMSFLTYTLDRAGHPCKDPHYNYRGTEIATREIKEFYAELKDNGVIDMVVAQLGLDEPELHCVSAETVRLVNQDMRSVMAKFPVMHQTKLWVIYGAGTGLRDLPGIETFDAVGFDDYRHGDQIFLENGQYQALKNVLRPDQGILLIPGGSFGQDPKSFLEIAQSDAQIVGVICFTWFDNPGKDGWDHGIRTNGLAPLYCRMGALLIHPEIPEPDCSGNPTALFSLKKEKATHLRQPAVTTVSVGDLLDYEWSSTHGTQWFSYWTTDNAACGGGSMSGDWEAVGSAGTLHWPADISQAGCTYEITYVACGFMSCASDSHRLRVLHNMPFLSRGKPRVVLTVNGEHTLAVTPGTRMHYAWSSAGATTWSSSWKTTNAACSWGLTGGAWDVGTAWGASDWPADSSQVGCTFEITYSACTGQGNCASDSISIDVRAN